MSESGLLRFARAIILLCALFGNTFAEHLDPLLMR
jgi:hypothetical protein